MSKEITITISDNSITICFTSSYNKILNLNYKSNKTNINKKI